MVLILVHRSSYYNKLSLIALKRLLQQAKVPSHKGNGHLEGRSLHLYARLL